MPLDREVGLSPGNIVLDGDPASPSAKRGHSSPPLFGPCLLWPNGWMDEDATWYEGRHWASPHCVRWGLRLTSSPPERGTAAPPHFLADNCCGQTARWIKVPLGTKVGLGSSDTVLDGDSSPKRRHSPLQFLVHVCCGQTVGWIKMPLNMEVGLGQGKIVFDGGPS